ncbi:erythromycin esterase family protein [Bacillus sp. AK128]
MKCLFLLFLISLLLLGCTTEPELSDENMTVKEIDGEPEEDENIYKEYFNEYGFPIDLGKAQNFDFLKDLLKDKKYLFLGENGHSIAEFNQVKTELIPYLHEELDFDVLVFETGFPEANIAYSAAKDLSYHTLMKYSVWATWHSDATLQLFKYISDQAQTDDPLILTGLDITSFTSEYAGTNLTEYELGSFLQEWFLPINSDMAALVKDTEEKYAQTSYLTSQEEREELTQKYKQVLQFVEEQKESLLETYPNSQDMIPTLIESIKHRVWVLQEVYDEGYLDLTEYTNDYQKNISLRDHAALEQFIQLTEERYPDKKILFWYHNYHIMKDANKINMVDQDLKTMYEPMPEYLGTILPDSIKEQSYVLGLFMDSGSIVSDGQRYSIPPKEKSTDLEWILKQNEDHAFWVDLSNERTRPEWLNETLSTYEEGFFEYKLNPSEQYDGLLFIETVSPTIYR